MRVLKIISIDCISLKLVLGTPHVQDRAKCYCHIDGAQKNLGILTFNSNLVLKNFMIYINHKDWEKTFVMYDKGFLQMNIKKKTMENWANCKNDNSQNK